MNGYFRLVLSENATDIELFPPTDGGEPLELSEVTEYLKLQKVDGFDLLKLSKALRMLGNDPTVVPLIPKPIFPIGETYSLKISEDKMQAVARFYPPTEGAHVLTREDIIKDLNFKKVTVGINTEAIDSFLKQRQYCFDYLLAEGRLPRQGRDASIEYFFNTDQTAKPAVKEDGSVDFFNLNTINHCREGDLLARLTKAVPSFPGADIFGGMIKGRDVKVLSLKHGKNISVSPDGVEMRSLIDGHVSLVDDEVFVSDVYEVENVGTATGNIDSTGSVVVSGNVQSGFSIRATGNVEIRGVVEGATIEADGDIIIGRGMNGMGKGTLRAGGRIVAKYIENATVKSEGFIEAESILHSQVSSNGEIEVTGKRGIIAGGIVRATSKITCKTLGSSMGADTAVEVGVDPSAKERYQFLQKDLVELQKSIRNMKTVIENFQKKISTGVQLSPEQIKYVKTLMNAFRDTNVKLQEESREFDQLDDAIRSSGHACIVVNGEVYPGTKVTIGDASLIVKDNIKFCRLIRESGEVKLAAI